MPERRSDDVKIAVRFRS